MIFSSVSCNEMGGSKVLGRRNAEILTMKLTSKKVISSFMCYSGSEILQSTPTSRLLPFYQFLSLSFQNKIAI